MLSKLTAVIPFWKPFGDYPREAHSKALRKFVFLWVVSILPIIGAASLRPISITQQYSLYSFFLNVLDVFSNTHQFIYAVSFITPMIYLLYERYKSHWQYILSGTRSKKYLHRVPLGFDWAVCCSALVFFFTLFAFAHTTEIKDTSETTFLKEFARQSSFYVYLFALVCWYFTILDAIGLPTQSYPAAVQQNDEKLLDQFNKKLKKKKEPNV